LEKKKTGDRGEKRSLEGRVEGIALARKTRKKGGMGGKGVPTTKLQLPNREKEGMKKNQLLGGEERCKLNLTPMGKEERGEGGIVVFSSLLGERNESSPVKSLLAKKRGEILRIRFREEGGGLVNDGC